MIRPLTSYFFATGAWFLAYGMQTVLFAWLVTIVLNASPDKVGILRWHICCPVLYLC